MPAQSGSTSMLARMRRGYSRDAYDALVDRIRAVVPGVSFSTDIIVGEEPITFAACNQRAGSSGTTRKLQWGI